MTQHETELQMVRRHVAEGERHVASQRDIIAHLQAQDYPAELAEQLLANLEELLVLHRQHLARLEADATP